YDIALFSCILVRNALSSSFLTRGKQHSKKRTSSTKRNPRIVRGCSRLCIEWVSVTSSCEYCEWPRRTYRDRKPDHVACIHNHLAIATNKAVIHLRRPVFRRTRRFCV